MATTQQFREEQQGRSDSRLSIVLDRIPQDIAAGVSYHQVPSLGSGPLRTRSSQAPVSEGELWNNDGNAFGPKVATVLLSQMKSRGMDGAELVHAKELSKLGHQKLPEKRMDSPLVAVRSGAMGVAVPIDGADRVVTRGSSYDLLHVETQTTLRPVPKRLMDGRNRDERDTIERTVKELVGRSGVRLKTHAGDRISVSLGGDGPQVAHPAREKFRTSAVWATSVMRSVCGAISRSPALQQHVQDEELGRRAVASARRTEGRAIVAGTSRYAEVLSAAAGEVANRGVKAIAAREGVYLATDQPREESRYDAESRTFHPQRKPSGRPGPGEPDTREQQFQERMLADLAKAVGTPEERKAAEAERPLEVAQAAGVRVPGMNPAPEGLTPAQVKARTGMVADLAARSTLERLGIEYAPAPPSDQARKDQSEYAKQPGAMDQAWRESASIRAHLVSRDWEIERTPEMLAHSAQSTFEPAVRARAAEKAPAREQAVEQPADGGPEQVQQPSEPLR